MSINLRSHAFAGSPLRSKTPKSGDPFSPSQALEILKTCLLDSGHVAASTDFKVLPFRKGRYSASSSEGIWKLGCGIARNCWRSPGLRWWEIMSFIWVRGRRMSFIGRLMCLGRVGSVADWAERYDHHIDKIGKNSPDGFGNLRHSFDQDFAQTGPIMNRVKKRELLLDDVGGCPPLKNASSFGNNLSGGAKGKRSERDPSGRNSVAKASNHKSERKTKSKPKQKIGQLSTSGNVSITTGSGEIVASGSNRKREVGLISQGNNNPENQSTETREPPMDFPNLQLHELESIELGVENELDGNQDLSSWLNIEEDGLPDHDSIGLDIPMDDLSDLNMII
ncbi:hypothetical protein L484_018360 [Morus notabilis]|uniref:Uncharacterized protein n=1 Tax=Morus notabilis TaxID=981085 RepID=W9QGG3_9ROSA|nr:hypothetical protein L484_018360 [Morus notabilis]